MRKASSLTVTDQFCGAGGTSLGAVQAGAEVKLALNHWKLAIETHNTNFPNTWHDCTDISACDPRRYPSTDILLTSPECTNHSLAKGRRRKDLGQPGLWEPVKIDPAEERSRATMLDVPRFAEFHRYELIIVENVVEARYWILFDEWLLMMQKLGYRWEIVYYNSMFAPPIPQPTPQSRDRMYVVFWKRGNPAPDLRFTPPAYCAECERQVEAVQSWKNPARKWGRYGRNRQYVYRCPHCAGEVVPFYAAAANAIEWDLPIRRIGERTRPLKERTLRRIELGLRTFADAFLLAVNKTSDRLRPLDAPLPTQTGDNGLALVSPFLVGLSHRNDEERGPRRSSVMPPRTGRQGIAFYGPGATRQGADPLSTVTAPGNHHHHGLLLCPPRTDATPALSFLISYYGQEKSVRPVDVPLGTITTLDRHALVVPDPASWQIEDCFFRMLHPSEIGRAMAFPDSYVVLGSAREKVKQYGNAVTPPVMKMLLERCIQTLQ